MKNFFFHSLKPQREFEFYVKFLFIHTLDYKLMDFSEDKGNPYNTKHTHACKCAENSQTELNRTRITRTRES